MDASLQSEELSSLRLLRLAVLRALWATVRAFKVGPRFLLQPEELSAQKARDRAGELLGPLAFFVHQLAEAPVRDAGAADVAR